jgi:hypothetical protein
MEEIHREKDEPWSYCISGEESVESCRVSCIFLATSEKCGCRLLGDETASLSYCTSSDYNCTSTISQYGCSFLLPYQEQEYRTSYSAGQISQRFY